MAHEPLERVVKHLRKSLGAREAGGTTDADLLDRFATERNEAAFAALLQRHGSLVQGVCRRVLGNATDAEDAFQATFLVLVRKAGAIHKGASVAGWLYGVARRVALEARTRAARRRAHEQRAETARPSGPPDEAAARELRSILDEELGHLPTRYRTPLVLHYLAGKTKEEAARQLGWTEGTVSGRLARARALLRRRLARRGVMLSGTMLATALSQEAAAAVSATLTEATLKTAVLFAAGETAAGATQITALTERVVRAMLLTKMKVTTALVLVAAAVGLGAGELSHHMQARSPADSSRQALGPPRKLASATGASEEQRAVAPGKRGGPLLRVPMPERTMMTVALAAQGNGLAVSRQDGTTIQLWDVASGQEHTLRGHAFSVTALAFSPDGKTLASATGSWLPDGAPGEIKLWDVAAGKESASLGRLPTMVIALAFSPDGKTLATASKTVKLWDVATGKETREFQVSGGPTWGIAFAPDGKTLAAGVGVLEDNTPGSVVLWDLTTGKERATLSGHKGTVPCVAFTPDGRTLASADSKGTVQLWDVASAKERITISNPDHTFFLQSLVVTSDSKTVLATLMGKEGPVLKEWDVASGQERSSDRGNLKGFPVGLSEDGMAVLLGVPAEGTRAEGGLVDGKAMMELWELPSLGPNRPKPPNDAENPSPEQPRPQQADDREVLDRLRETVTKLGGQVTRDEKAPGGPALDVNLNNARVTDDDLRRLFKGVRDLRSLVLSGTAVTDAGLEHLRGLVRLHDLHLARTRVTGAGVEALAGLSDLRYLDLSETAVTDEGLKHAAELKNLQTLHLLGTAVTGAGLEHLQGLKKLETLFLNGTRVADLRGVDRLTALQHLYLARTPVTDKGLTRLQELTELRTLTLTRTQVTDAGLESLRGLAKLETLNLRQTSVTDKGLEALSGLTSLRDLDLTGTRVTDAGLAKLKGLKGLVVLLLDDTTVTDRGLEELKGLTDLQSLGLLGTRVTPEGVQAIRQALPKVHIILKDIGR